MPNNRNVIHYLSEPIFITEQTWNEGVTPLVSVLCVTYNHASYICEAIDSFLEQKTTFPVEILINDDASTDGTTNIIKEYEKKYPDLIFPIYHTENQYSKGKKGLATYLLPRASGKYIALCDGDDYWVDPLKLQKQVGFLETNPEYSGTSHQSMVIYTDEFNKKPHLHDKHNITNIETNDLLNGRLFHTASFMFRSDIIKRHTLPTDITSNDRALLFLVTKFGKIHYSNETMCYYRKHAGGVSSWVTTEMLEKDFKIVPWISKINPKFPRHRYYQFLHWVALVYPSSLSFLKIIKHSFLYVYHWLFTKPYDFHNLRIFIIYHFPSFLKKVRIVNFPLMLIKRFTKHVVATYNGSK